VPSAQAGRRLDDFFRAHGNPDGDTTRLPLWIETAVPGLPTPLHLERNVVVTLQAQRIPGDRSGVRRDRRLPDRGGLRAQSAREHRQLA
jgi:hypothetical protein